MLKLSSLPIVVVPWDCVDTPRARWNILSLFRHRWDPSDCNRLDLESMMGSRLLAPYTHHNTQNLCFRIPPFPCDVVSIVLVRRGATSGNS